MPHDEIDPSRIRVRPLAERESFLDIRRIAVSPDSDPPAIADALASRIDLLAGQILAARRNGASVMLTYGAHLVKNGCGPLVNALIAGGWVTHLATHGAGVIHDWEFAHTGRSSESVRGNAPVGRFGTWDETGRNINLAAVAAAAEGLGFGEGMGRFISTDGVTLPDADKLAAEISADPAGPLAAAKCDLLAMMKRHNLRPGRVPVEHPCKQYSVFAAAYEAGVAMTVHPGIGYDIFTNHPMFCGAAIGRAAATDFRIFAASVANISGGVYMSVGSAIMSPQVFEKAFSVANNIREAGGERFIRGHHIAVVDIQDGGGWNWAAGEPPEGHPAYYLRFCKSFYRMGGTVDYLCGDNRAVLANLLARLKS